MPKVEVRTYPVPPEEVPPEPVSVTMPFRDCTFDPPGPSVVLDRIPIDRVRFEAPGLAQLRIHECEFVDCTFTGKLAETGTLGAFGNWQTSSRFGRSVSAVRNFNQDGSGEKWRPSSPA